MLRRSITPKSVTRGLHGQFLAATTPAGGENAAAVLGGHAGTETMHLAALALFGLIRTEHVSSLLFMTLRENRAYHDLFSLRQTAANSLFIILTNAHSVKHFLP